MSASKRFRRDNRGWRRVSSEKHANGLFVLVMITCPDEYDRVFVPGRGRMVKTTRRVLLKGKNGRGREFGSRREALDYADNHIEELFDAEEAKPQDGGSVAVHDMDV